ncbi:MAG: hypothetical protein ACREUG_16320 [Steroidobacteraceae bacterium]
MNASAPVEDLEGLGMRIGALIEAAERQRSEAEAAVERFTLLSRGLEQVVRDEIRAAFVEEFEALGEASRRAGDALRVVRRSASVRIALWAAAVAVACCIVPVMIARTVLPSPVELARLRGERKGLEQAVAALVRRGGHIDLRRCSAAGRLCVRVDRSTPAYGAEGDYLVLKGY